MWRCIPKRQWIRTKIKASKKTVQGRRLLPALSADRPIHGKESESPDKHERVTPKEGRLVDMVSDLEESFGRTLSGLCRSEVKSKKDGECCQDPEIGAGKVRRQATIPKRFYAKAGEKEQTDDRDTGEGVIDMIDPVEERNAKDEPRGNDPEDKGQGEHRHYAYPP